MFGIFLECDVCHKKMTAHLLSNVIKEETLWTKGWGLRIEDRLKMIRKAGNGKDVCGKCLLEMNNG